MKVKHKHYKVPNTRWITKRGSDAQWGLLKRFRFDYKLGRKDSFAIRVPGIPYERFMMASLFAYK